MDDSLVPQVGKSYYIMAHAYHHFLGEVVAVGPKYVVLKNCVRVYSCGRPWDRFFAEGLGSDTNCARFPDGSKVPYALGAFPWDHATLPAGKEKRK